MTKPSGDRVEREIVVRASIERAYAALTDPALFPTWGPMRIEGTLAVGERPIFDFGPAGGGKVAVYVVALEAPRYFAYRWAQGATEPAILEGDPLAVASTLVEFLLEPIEDGTRVRVVESGLDALPGNLTDAERAARNEHMGAGWQLMLGGLPQHFVAAELGLQDRIENERLVSVPLERVYAALSQPETWWAQRVDGTLAPGELPILDFGPFGKIRIYVVAAEPSHYLAYRWVQGLEDPARRLDDPRQRPSTLIEFRIEAVATGTRLRQIESGFAALPGDDVFAFFKRAHQGWGIILGMLEMHLGRP